jgi:hypothetical protein
MEEVDEIFGMMKKGLEKNSIRRMLKGPVATTGFARLA